MLEYHIVIVIYAKTSYNYSNICYSNCSISMWCQF